MNCCSLGKNRYSLYVALLLMFSIINISENEMLTYVFFAGMIAWLLFCSNDNSYMIFFLIPNINILNVAYFPVPPINVWMMILGLKYIFTKNIENKDKRKTYFCFKIDRKILLCGSIVFLNEVIHYFCYLEIVSFAVNLISITIGIMVFLYLVYDSDEEKWNVYSEALAIGVIVSFVVNILSYPGLIDYIFSTKYRLEAFANDPNYYSMHILVSLIAVLRKIERNIGNKILNYIFTVLLSIIGLLTSSKMCIICLGVIYVAFVISSLNLKYRTRLKFLFSIVPVVIVGICIMKDQLGLLIQKVTSRFLLQSTKTIDLDTITSGRSTIINEYINKLSNDLGFLLWGKGMEYNISVAGKGNLMNVAHNTYMDLLLSWGIVGSVIFLFVVYFCLKSKISFKKKTVFDLLGIEILAIMLLALSCFSADMFWYLLGLSLIPLKKYCRKV